ncbi:peptidyl-prolyl cis-trans isomerase CYP40-like [Primulina tabacum]|uniref:peptidyl-prolyl cis-trans isomerase CYP40-like n=1 Tax=Primulina tabacum TaxID=48773 RepID=UPI003F599D9E
MKFQKRNLNYPISFTIFKDVDVHPEWPVDLDAKPDDISWLITAVDSIKVLGMNGSSVLNFYMYRRKTTRWPLESTARLSSISGLCWEMEDINEEDQDLLSPLFCIGANEFASLLQVCKLRSGNLKGALLDADIAIRDGKDNAKAFYHQGQIFLCKMMLELNMLLQCSICVGVYGTQQYRISEPNDSKDSVPTTVFYKIRINSYILVTVRDGGVKKELAIEKKKVTGNMVWL